MNNQESSLKKNFIYNVGYQILVIFLPLITTPYISRVLGAEQIGIYSYTYSIAYNFMLITMLGVSNYGNRCIAQVRDSREELTKTFWQIYSFQFIRGIFVFILYIIFIFLFQKSNIFIGFIQGIYLFSGIIDITWLFFGMEKFKITISQNAIIRIINLILIFLLVKKTEDLWIYTLIMSASILFSQIYLWFYIKKYIGFYKVKLKEIIPHIKPELILFVPIIAISIYKIMDKIMIGFLSTMTQVGYYQNSEKIVTIPLSIITALGTVMLPRMSNLVSRGNVEKGMEYIRESMVFVMFISCALCFGIAGISPVFTPIFFGKDFLYCIELISLLSITIVFISWANVIRTQYLIPNKMDREYIISVFLGAFVNIILNLILIPKFQALGAVIGTIFAEASVCICQTIMVRKKLDIKLYLKEGLPFVFIGVLMFLLVRILCTNLPSNIIYMLVEIIIGAIFYLTCTLIYMKITKNILLIKIERLLKNTYKKILKN